MKKQGIRTLAAALLAALLLGALPALAADGEDGAEERVLDHLLLKELLTSLDKEERKLIYLRYFAEKTQTQIGKEMGISQVQVSRMEKKILKNLRERI